MVAEVGGLVELEVGDASKATSVPLEGTRRSARGHVPNPNVDWEAVE